MTTPSAPSLSTRLVGAAALVGLVLLAYSGSFRAAFVFDDIPSIVENPTIRNLGAPGDVLWPDLPGGVTPAGRPVLNLSLAVNYAISGLQPWSYHALNVLIHATASVLLFLLADRLVRRVPALATSARLSPTWMAWGLAAIWALHPLQTQAVTYTIQRAESLMGCCYLLGLFAFVVGAESRRPARAWTVCIAAALLAMGTKEVAATLPVLVLLLDRTFYAGSFADAWRQRRGLYLALAATWVWVALLVFATGGNRGGTVGFGVAVTAPAYWLTQFVAVGQYLRLAVWPYPQVFEYGTFWVTDVVSILPQIALVLGAVGLTGWALVRRPVLGFLGAWFLLILAPTSLMPGTVQMIVEHRMYLPLAAIAALAAVAVARCPPRAALPLGAVMIAALGVLTWMRNGAYATPTTLWADTLERRPENVRALQNLGTSLLEEGRVTEALRAYETTRLHDIDDPDYLYNYGVMLYRAGRIDEAVSRYERARALRPADARVHGNLGLALAALGRFPEAVRFLEEAVRLQPKNPELWHNLALQLQRSGRLDEARRGFEAALALDAHLAASWVNLGNVALRQGDPTEAVRCYEHALREQSDLLEAHVNAAVAYRQLNRPDAAREHAREALARAPRQPLALRLLGELELEAGRRDDSRALLERAFAEEPISPEAVASWARWWTSAGETGRAEQIYREAVARAPDHPVLRFQLGNVLFGRERFAEAAAAYLAAVQLRPDYADAWFNLGTTRLRLRDVAGARQAFERVIALRPEDAVAYAELGNVCALLGDRAAATRALETALRLQPDFAAARAVLESVKGRP